MAGSGLVPPQLSYPGVYIQEVNAQSLTVPAIPTSLTAFVGRARQGPVNTPVLIENIGQFATLFGGLWKDSELSYAVSDFFANGGSQCLVVRLFVDTPTATELKITGLVGGLAAPPKGSQPSGIATIGIGPPPKLSKGTSSDVIPSPLPAYSGKASLTLFAASPGDWGNALFAWVDQRNITDAAVNALGLGLDKSQFFNLYLAFNPTDPNQVASTESFGMVTLAQGGGANRLDRVLKASSTLAAWTWNATEADTKPDWIALWQANVDAMAKNPLMRPLSQNPVGLGGFNGYYLQSPEVYTSPALLAEKAGVYALEKVQIFNILCIPRDQPGQDNMVTYADIFAYANTRKVFWVLDSPLSPSTSFESAILNGTPPASGLITAAFENPGSLGRNAAVYFPDIQAPDPLLKNYPRSRGPCGMIAGIYARTDAARGNWKAPAGQQASLVGINGPALPSSIDESGTLVNLTDAQCGIANLVGINCLMNFPTLGSVVWGARTLEGATALNDVYKYVPVRRLTLWIEQELQTATQWAVFEPNDETLWSSLRLQIGGFLQGLWLEGAFMGATQSDAFYVQCDANTTTVTDQLNGVVNIVVGIAPVRPAEFVVIYIQQILQTS